MDSFKVRTAQRDEMVDITRQVDDIVRQAAVGRALCVVFVPHTTAGVTINEHADPDIARDIIAALDRMVPWNGPYAHSEGNSAAHVKASVVGPSVAVPVEAGKLQLGTWQGIFLCEFDGPRTRQVWVSLLQGS